MKRYCAVFLLVVLLSAGFGYVIQLVKAEPMARAEDGVIITEDFDLRFRFTIDEEANISRILFVFKNKTKDILRIIWDHTLFIDEHGKAHRVIHSGVRYREKDKPMPPTEVSPGASIADVIHPVDYVYFSEEWKELPVVLSPINKEFSVALAVQHGNKERCYTYKFYVKPTPEELEALRQEQARGEMGTSWIVWTGIIGGMIIAFTLFMILITE